MLEIQENSSLVRIESIVRGFLKGDNAQRVIGLDDDLDSFGLTSMDMVNLMLAIEAEFDVTIPGSKLIPVNFRSLERIAALIAELTS